MNRFFSRRRVVAGAVLSLFAHAAIGQLPKTQTANGVDYIMGGVGSDESEALRAEGKWWPLVVEFSERTADGDVWISDTRVRILNASEQTVFDQVCDGPFLLVNLPTGSYTIAAQHKSSIKLQKVQLVRGESRKVIMHW